MIQIIDSINKLRDILISKGSKSLFIIEKMLTMYDNNKTGKIDLSTLIKILETYKIINYQKKKLKKFL